MIEDQRTGAIGKACGSEAGKLREIAFHVAVLLIDGADSLPSQQQDDHFGDDEECVSDAVPVAARPASPRAVAVRRHAMDEPPA